MNKSIICWGLMVFAWASASHASSNLQFSCDSGVDHSGSRPEKINFRINYRCGHACREWCERGINIRPFGVKYSADPVEVMGLFDESKFGGNPDNLHSIQIISVSIQAVIGVILEKQILTGGINGRQYV